MKRLRNSILGFFEDIALRYNFHGMAPCTRRTRAYGREFGCSSIPLTGGLRLEAGNGMILVEADGGGGTNHLVNCWRVLTHMSGQDGRNIKLFYVYIVPWGNVSDAQREAWNFVRIKVEGEFGNLFQAQFATCMKPRGLCCHAEIPTEIIKNCEEQLEVQGILAQFRQLVDASEKNTHLCIDNPLMTSTSLSRRKVLTKGGG